MKIFYALMALLCFFLPLAAEAEAPDVMLKSVTEEVLQIIHQDKDISAGNLQKINDLIEEKILMHFNFRRMTALAVGRDWRGATEAQKQKLTESFKGLLVRTYASALRSVNQQRVDFRPIKMKPEDKEVMIRMEVSQPGSKALQIDSFLEKTSDDRWLVFDVSVAGVSLITNYREQFAQEIRKNGIESLITSLEARNREQRGM